LRNHILAPFKNIFFSLTRKIENILIYNNIYKINEVKFIKSAAKFLVIFMNGSFFTF
jgi:genome